MAKKPTKKTRFNYMMTETERNDLNILQEHSNIKQGRGGTTIGSILRKLVSDEVKRIKTD